MKYCPTCGTKLIDAAAFCSNCGTAVGTRERTSAATPNLHPAGDLGAVGIPDPSYHVEPPKWTPEDDKTIPVRPPKPASPGYSAPEAPGGYAPPPAPPAGSFRPVGQLRTNRSLAKFILLTLITFGIYGIVVLSTVSTDINAIAGRYDGKETMHYCLIFFLLSPLTFGIAMLVWQTRISSRIGDELYRRGIPYEFGAGSYWGWCILGSLILVGPFVYLYKLLHSMNKLAEHYNVYG